MPSQDEMEAALAAVRSMGIGADKMSDELICEELQYNDWNQHQVVQNYYDGTTSSLKDHGFWVSH